MSRMDGGFMKSPGGTGAEDSPSRTVRKDNRSGHLSVTIRQCLLATKSDDGWVIDGRDISSSTNVIIVARVESTSFIQTLIDAQVCDGTGIMSIRMFASSNSQGHFERLFNDIATGEHIRVIGTLRDIDGGRCIAANSVTIIGDDNEIVLHFLDAISQHYAHLEQQKSQGRAVGGAASSSSAPGAYGSAMSSAMASSGRAITSAPAQAPSGQDGEVRTPLQQAIMEVCAHHADNPSGANINDIRAYCIRLGFRGVDVQVAANELLTQGSLYSTSDENHYKSTGS